MKKKILANIFYYTGISYILFRFKLLFIDFRSINYHCTPESDIKQFELHLKFFKKYFSNTTKNDLNNYFYCNKKLNKTPGIIITFDDGLRSNFDFALNLLNKYNFTGWFFIPVGFILNPSLIFAKKNLITVKQEYKDGRFGMNLLEINELKKNHIIGSHTYTHHRMNENDTDEILNFEITNSKLSLERLLENYNVECFCWVGGEPHTYTKKAFEKIKKSNYKYVFATITEPITKNTSPFMIHRTNIETNNSIPLVMFQLSGLMDLFHTFRRIKIENKLIRLN